MVVAILLALVVGRDRNVLRADRQVRMFEPFAPYTAGLA